IGMTPFPIPLDRLRQTQEKTPVPLSLQATTYTGVILGKLSKSRAPHPEGIRSRQILAQDDTMLN
ncbi:MAG: hypothetical protein AAF773_29620, partial [Cyanobacteria bacterium P01_D01_bin.115]